VLPTARGDNGQLTKRIPQAGKKHFAKNKNAFAMRVLRSIYSLKQSDRIWYKKFKAKMLAEEFTNNDIAPCLFIKRLGNEFVIVALYVDDKNLFGTTSLTAQTIDILNSIFKMKDL
jgi:hypothetical protein